MIGATTAFNTLQRLPGPLTPWLVSQTPLPVTIKRNSTHWQAHGDTHTITLTRPQEAARYLIGTAGVDGLITQKLNRYQNPEVGVTVHHGDTVLDVGSYLGETVLGYVQRGADVIALEPDPRSYAALSHTTRGLDAVETRQQAAWHTPDQTHTFNLAPDPSESSIRQPDTGGVIGAVDATTTTIHEIATETAIDYCKVEAEGSEPEVLDGLQPGDVDKIAVNVDPERDGASPRDAVRDQLRELEYTVVERDRTVFGTWTG